jgi:hypothetical protein
VPTINELVEWLCHYQGNKAKQAGLVQCYLNVGAQVQSGRQHENPLVFALRFYPEPDLLNAMLSNKIGFDGVEPLLAAECCLKSSDQTFALLKEYWPFLLQHGLDVNARDPRLGNTLLHQHFNRQNYVIRLMDMGCDPFVVNNKGETAEQALPNGDFYPNVKEAGRESAEIVASYLRARHHDAMPMPLRPGLQPDGGYFPREAGAPTFAAPSRNRRW